MEQNPEKAHLNSFSSLELVLFFHILNFTSESHIYLLYPWAAGLYEL